MVTIVDPEPKETVHDPACGTGGFLLAAWEHMRKKPLARSAEVYTAMRSRFSGIDIVPELVKLCAMNLYLHERAETERFRRFAHAELVARDKVNLDIFWLKDDTLDDPDLLPPPDETAAEIVENLEAALDRFRKVAHSLQPG
jgi:N-6 DNA Methylase